MSFVLHTLCTLRKKATTQSVLLAEHTYFTQAGEKMHAVHTGPQQLAWTRPVQTAQTLPASAVGDARDSWWGRTCPFPGKCFPLVASLHVFALHRRPLKHANVYNACHALTPLEDKDKVGKKIKTGEQSKTDHYDAHRCFLNVP